jgi:phosphoenolpyruvate---glycerone phosphotransferase subunit DhaK
MKQLINRVEDVVKEDVARIVAAHSDRVRVHFEPNFVVRADAPVSGKAAIVSDGGSGHEPRHGGFVGVRIVDAACPGPNRMTDGEGERSY